MKPLRGRAREAGQSIIEFVIIAPILLFMCLGITQFVLLYQAKATLDSAALEAAREGAVNHATLHSLQVGLARGLAPLYARASTPEGVVAARSIALQVVQQHVNIEVINPTPVQLQEFGQNRYDPATDATVLEIPNELLRYRANEIGPESGTNIQDANLLKIRVHYCYDMYVPFVNRVLYYAINAIGDFAQDGIMPLDPGDANQDPYGSPKQPDYLCRTRLQDGSSTGRWPIAIESEAMVRMQSAYRGETGQTIPMPGAKR
ncbi:TadE/TadG family type IV pilus assembly protein [Burkholderia pyrrocinia]|uniref:TadE/TadG family type IV pilus assembly protein n=1 Tax=Burkholderia pyrrocinia TaxID=60550 RepID=UPI00104E2638|nr:TadE family protein [Burkholderia pyrrocinia]TDA47465.1 pilus assembly protein [Burkholderia pyrrocinia]